MCPLQVGSEQLNHCPALIHLRDNFLALALDVFYLLRILVQQLRLLQIFSKQFIELKFIFSVKFSHVLKLQL